MTDIEKLMDRVDKIEAEIDRLVDRVEEYGASEDRQIDHLHFVLQDAIDSLRSDLSALERKVDG